MPFEPPAPFLVIDLQAGQLAWQRVRRGSTLRVQAGAVMLYEAPQWLGERVVQGGVPLHAGAVHRVERSGWLRLDAAAAARCRIEAPVSVVRRALERLTPAGTAAPRAA